MSKGVKRARVVAEGSGDGGGRRLTRGRSSTCEDVAY